MSPRVLFLMAPLAIALVACAEEPKVSEVAPSAETSGISAEIAPTSASTEVSSTETLRFAAGGRSLQVDGATCAAQSSHLLACTGDIRITVIGVETLGPIRLRELLLTKEFPLHVGEGDIAKLGATPSFALVDYDRDGLEDLAVAVDRIGGYGQLSYAIYLRRADGWMLSPEFSALTEGRMGIPRREGDAWVALGKSGCCQQWEERYDVVEGKPVLREAEITTSSADGTTKTEVIRGEDAEARARGER